MNMRPESPALPIDPPSQFTKQSFRNALLRLGETHGLQPDWVEGLYNYALHHGLHQNLRGFNDAIKIAMEIHRITEGQPFFKMRSFNYIGEDPRKLASQAPANASYWLSVMGRDFFHPNPNDFSERSSLYVSPFPSGDHFLSCKAGGGAGTFSVDFAVGMMREKGMGGELWRVGCDMQQDGDQSTFRVIRTGSGIRSSASNFEEKTASARDFAKRHNLTAQRLLGFLALMVAHDLGFDSAQALTTEGAYRLSSLRKSKGGFDYSTFFQGLGFPVSCDHWSSIPDFQHNLHRSFYSSEGRVDGLQLHEDRSLDIGAGVFNQMTELSDGSACPLKVAQQDDPVTVARAIQAAFIRRKVPGYTPAILGE